MSTTDELDPNSILHIKLVGDSSTFCGIERPDPDTDFIQNAKYACAECVRIHVSVHKKTAEERNFMAGTLNTLTELIKTEHENYIAAFPPSDL